MFVCACMSSHVCVLWDVLTCVLCSELQWHGDHLKPEGACGPQRWPKQHKPEAALKHYVGLGSRLMGRACWLAENLGLDLQHPCNKLGAVAHACSPSTGEVRRIPGANWQAVAK